MNKHSRFLIIIYLHLVYFNFNTYAQESLVIENQRAEENYFSLKDSANLAWNLALKYIALDKRRISYISIGGFLPS